MQSKRRESHRIQPAKAPAPPQEAQGPSANLRNRSRARPRVSEPNSSEDDKPQGPSKKTRRKRKAPKSHSSDDDAESKETGPKDRLEITPLDPAKDPASGETAPTKIKQPISALVHHSLTNAWEVNPDMKMCFIFDAVSPARQFKRGTKFSDSKQFPDYDDTRPGDVTETEGKSSLMPYMPRTYEYVFRKSSNLFILNFYPSWKFEFRSTITAVQLLNWRKDELRTVTLEHTQKRKGKKGSAKILTEFQIPAAYHQLVCQLGGEIAFANTHDIHEARRRQVYARQVLDLFGKELKWLRGYSDAAMITFRSRVLTPILARQLWGTDDAYTPSVSRAVQGQGKELTIEAATNYYLEVDPTDPVHIPNYRRNLLYVPMARWYIGRVLGNPRHPRTLSDYYDRVLQDHDKIMSAMKATGQQVTDGNPIPLLTEVEAKAIDEEGLAIFFQAEMARLVNSTCSHDPSTFSVLT
jgi:hypothetical protein